MALTWRRVPHPRVCGFCVPARVIPKGEWFLVVQDDGRLHVRCVDCATARWALEPPPPDVVAEGSTNGGREAGALASPFDWKRRAAGDD